MVAPGKRKPARGGNMQMHQIRYFLALCEEKSFTRAARRSGISQPSLTNAISALEHELGGTLFHRKPPITLTALGRALRPILKRIAQDAERAREIARAHARPAGARVPVPQPPARRTPCSSSCS